MRSQVVSMSSDVYSWILKNNSRYPGGDLTKSEGLPERSRTEASEQYAATQDETTTVHEWIREKSLLCKDLSSTQTENLRCEGKVGTRGPYWQRLRSWSTFRSRPKERWINMVEKTLTTFTETHTIIITKTYFIDIHIPPCDEHLNILVLSDSYNHKGSIVESCCDSRCTSKKKFRNQWLVERFHFSILSLLNWFIDRRLGEFSVSKFWWLTMLHYYFQTSRQLDLDRRSLSPRRFSLLSRPLFTLLGVQLLLGLLECFSCPLCVYHLYSLTGLSSRTRNGSIFTRHIRQLTQKKNGYQLQLGTLKLSFLYIFL